MFAFCIFTLNNLPENLTEEAGKAAIDDIGQKALHSHEMVIDEKIRSLIKSRVGIDTVSFFMLEGWEIYVVGSDVPYCLRKANVFLDRVKKAVGSKEIKMTLIKMNYSKDKNPLVYALPHIGWLVGVLVGFIVQLELIVITSIIFIVIATLVEGKEQIYSQLLRIYYDP